MRAFIALDSDDVDKSILFGYANSLSNQYGKILKPVSLDNFHITIRFLGDIMIDDEEKLTQLFESFTSFEEIELAVDVLGVFPAIDKPAVVWAGSSYINSSIAF